jgi:hypothetical protein
VSPRAKEFLDWFVNRMESQPDRSRSLSKRAPEEFDSIDERQDFVAAMEEAERLGAVSIEYGKRDARHLIHRIVLKNYLVLYPFLDRQPLGDRVAQAKLALTTAFPAPLPEIGVLIDEIAEGWAATRRPYGFGIGAAKSVDFLRALDAVLRYDPAVRSDLRTYSSKVADLSKRIETHRAGIARWFRVSGRFPQDADDETIFASLGLEKFPHPVLIGGPIAVGRADISALLYAGLPLESCGELAPTETIRSVLSIENFATFNRHVREARGEGDIVVYTGGFTSRAVRQVLGIVFSWCPQGCYHWGDIDPSGVEIALHIARSSGVDLRPHLMTPALAMAHGTPAPAVPIGAADHTRFADLAAFLASPDACHLEQERIDPVPPPAA